MERYKEETGGYQSLGEFLVAARKHCCGDHFDGRLKVMTEGVDSAGGVLVPPMWVDEVFHAALEEGIVRRRAIVLPTKSDKLQIPRFVETDRSASIFGGIRFYWLKETGDKADVAADPKVGLLELNAHEGVASFYVSNRLEDDVKAFEKFVKVALGRAVAFYEDAAFIWGTGGGQPLGIVPSGAMIVVARTAFGKVDISDVGNLAERLLPGSWKNAVWLINQTVLREWVNMVAAAANPAAVLDLSQMICLGRPIIVTEKCENMGTKGDFILADFSHYVIGDRELVISASRHVPNYWQRNMTFWKLWIRVDGQPTIQAPLTPYKGAKTVSAFVTLDTTS